MIYLDTSALLKLYIRESDSDQVQKLISSQSHPLPIWEIQELELVNAIRLKVFWQEITLDQADSQIALLKQRQKRGLYFFPDIDRLSLIERFHHLSKTTTTLGCRTMDIMHVACALEIGASQFLSYDQRQIALATHAGLNVNT